MRMIGAIFAALCVIGVTAVAALAQQPPAAPKAAPPAAAPTGPAAHYALLPVNERIAIQSDLIWAGDFNGTASGDFGDRSVAAVRAFQKRSNSRDTGILNPQERVALAAAGKAAQERVGWRLVTDSVTGARLGLPGKLTPQTAAAKGGTRWFASQGTIQVETFRVIDPGTTLPALFDRHKKEPERKVEYSLLRPDFFVVSGLQGLKKFYTRATLGNGEVRGMTVMYDQSLHPTMEPVVIAMSSAFTAFPVVAPVASAPAARRKVEYASGVVLSGAGHIVTDRQAIEACTTLVVAGIGDAERVAEADDLALLRVHGAPDVMPLTLASGDATELALRGIADPQLQGGGSAVTQLAARLSGQALAPSPPLGFAGAAALDAQGRLAGIVSLKPPAVVAGPPPVASQAALIPADAIRKLLAANNVAPATAAPGDAKASVVRVICVRK